MTYSKKDETTINNDHIFCGRVSVLLLVRTRNMRGERAQGVVLDEFVANCFGFFLTVDFD